MKILLCAFLLMSTVTAYGGEVYRESLTGFPLCVEGPVYNVFFRWSDRPLSRSVKSYYGKTECKEYQKTLVSPYFNWSDVDIDKDYSFLTKKIREELKQIEQGTYELRDEFLVEDYLKNHPIESYTVETNREMTKRYGQIFSAQIFKSFTESKKENKELLKNVLTEIKDKENLKNAPLARFKGKVKLVVSFGLGWQESYGKDVLYYIKNFLDDMRAMGLNVHFIKKDPFGTIRGNVEKMIPQLQQDMESGEDLIFVSLCKGTPELLAAIAELKKTKSDKLKGRILGHVNLSGMLGGAIFSDYSEEVLLPKIIAPLMKLIPSAEVKENAKMVDAIETMKTSIIDETISSSRAYLDQDILYVNVTGAPMSLQILQGASPMKPVIKYNSRNKFIDSANDGFLELPNTLIPESISRKQLTLVLDSSHMLSDGELYGHKIEELKTRRALYYSILKEILKTDPLYANELKK